MTLAHWSVLFVAAIVPLGCGISQPTAQGGPSAKAIDALAAESPGEASAEPSKAPLEPAKAQAEEPAREPRQQTVIDRSVPNQESLADAEKRIQSAFGADLKSAVTAPQKTALAGRLMATAAETKDDSPAAFALLQAAGNLATSAGDMGAAWKAWTLLAEQFEVDAVQLSHDSLMSASAAAKEPAQCEALLKNHHELIERCLAADRFELLEGVATNAEKLAALAGNSSAIWVWKEQREDMAALYANFAVASGAKTTLATNPDDARSHTELGRFLCFVKADWQAGLEHLRLGDDAVLKDAAEHESQLSDKAIGPLAVGESWCQVASSLKGRMRSNCLARAREHYLAAAPDLTGLDKALSDRRLAEIGEQLGRESSPAGKLPSDAYAAKFTGQSYVEIGNSTGILDLNSDFTIELWARWPASSASEYLAGDEAWPEFPKSVPVDAPCGWVLRYRTFEGRPMLDFTVGVKQRRDWLSTLAPVSAGDQWHHVAVCRAGDAVVLYLDGRPIAQNSVADLTLVASPTPVYLGCRKECFGDRNFGGEISRFRISGTARYTSAFQPTTHWDRDDAALVAYEFGSPPREGLIDDSSGHDRHGLLSPGVSVVRLPAYSVSASGVSHLASGDVVVVRSPLVGTYINSYTTNSTRREYVFDADGTVTFVGGDTVANAQGPIPRLAEPAKVPVHWRKIGEEYVGLIHWRPHEKFEIVTVDKNGLPHFALYVLEQKTVGSGEKSQ